MREGQHGLQPAELGMTAQADGGEGNKRENRPDEHAAADAHSVRLPCHCW